MRLWALGVAAFCVGFVHVAASAQTAGIAIDRFDVSERGSDWFVADSLDLRGDMRPALGFVLDYAHRPLVLFAGDGEPRTAIVRDQFLGHIGGSLVVAERLRLALTVPVAFLTEGESALVGGETLTAKQGTSFGDLRFSADVRIWGEYGDPATLAIGAQLFLASGSRESFTGDGKPRVAPHLSFAGQLGLFDYAVRASVHYREAQEVVGGLRSGTELGLVAAVGVTTFQRLLLVGAELWGSTLLRHDAAFKRASTPLELLFGVHVRPKDFHLAVGAGPGLTQGVGSPELRIVGTFEWAPKIEHDLDGDGILDEADACPARAGAAHRDASKNGCPLPQDRDLDRVLDVDDACPDHPGVPSSDAARNGCPSRKDRDRDGVFDTVDACPDLAGVASGDAALSGCPPDADRDGIVDADDACPNTAGVANDDRAQHGCPVARVADDRILIEQRVEFETNSARLLDSSIGALTEVMNVLREHTELSLVAIEGHTDGAGDAAYNKELSQRRAQAVRRWLSDHGVPASRLVAVGIGAERPIDTNDTPEGRQRNRRVELHVLEHNEQ